MRHGIIIYLRDIYFNEEKQLFRVTRKLCIVAIRNYKYAKIGRNSKAKKIILTQYFKVMISSKFKTSTISRK